jgi:hypothetical protein
VPGVMTRSKRRCGQRPGFPTTPPTCRPEAPPSGPARPYAQREGVVRPWV